MALAGALAWSSGAGEIKIGTLDLQKAMSDYYKWQEAVKEMKGKEAAYLKDLETLRLEGSKLLKEAQDLEELAASNALNLTQREEKKKSFERRRVDLRQFQMRYDDFRAQKEVSYRPIQRERKSRFSMKCFPLRSTLVKRKD